MYVSHPLFLQEASNALQHLERRQGVGEGGGAYLDGRSTRHEELDGVQAAADAAAADDGYVHRRRHLVHHAQGDGLDGGPRQAGVDGGDERSPAPVMTMTPTELSAQASSTACLISRSVSPVKEFMTWGRLMVIQAAP